MRELLCVSCVRYRPMEMSGYLFKRAKSGAFKMWNRSVVHIETVVDTEK